MSIGWVRPRGLGYHRGAKDPECGRVLMSFDCRTVSTEGVEDRGNCGDGCCTYYRCLRCGYRWTIEWPD